MYPPLWTSLLVAMHDDMKNASIFYVELKNMKLYAVKSVGQKQQCTNI